jgi:Kef-type K+ transport system membrane component KefB
MSIQHTEEILTSVLFQLIIILPAARVMGTLAHKAGQPRAVGEIVAGLMLGPSLFGYFMPGFSSALFTVHTGMPMQVLSQIGLILLMFQIGCDFEFDHLKQKRNRRAVVLIAFSSVVLPLCVGFTIGWFSQPTLAPDVDPIVYSLFVSIALAITAVPVLGRILREFDLTRSEVGVVAISAAAINDAVGWVLLAVVTAIASSGFSWSSLALQITGLAVFGLFLALIGSRLVSWMHRAMPMVDDVLPPTMMVIVLVAIFASGIVTEKLGIFTIFGGFVFGLLFHRYPRFVAVWQSQVGRFVLVFFLPIFFTYTGLRTNILGLSTPTDWIWGVVIFAGATMAKVVPVYFSAKMTGFSNSQSGMLGILMNTRALMELIVLNVGYSLGFIPQNVFTMLVLMAIGTTILTGPVLRVLLKAAGLRVDRFREA